MYYPVHQWRAALTVLACLAALGLGPAAALAQPDYEFQWSVIGAPGNRGTNGTEIDSIYSPSFGRGGVDYTYRITTSKVSVNQYLDFVRAYAPHWQASVGDIHLLGYWGQVRQNGDGTYDFFPREGAGNFGARITWQMSARYCNWLHNGKSSEAWAFESGVYDTSTFYYDGTYHHQTTPSPGAKFWIPSLDEWVKAVYYDPNRDGPGQGGYWRFPNSSNTPLRMGLPQDGGETIGDLLWQDDPARGLGGWDLWQYPGVRTPWGLVDVSATVEDYTGTRLFTAGSVAALGSLAGTAYYAVYDQVGFNNGPSLVGSWGGLRIASDVPGPGCSIGMCLGILFRRERRCNGLVERLPS